MLIDNHWVHPMSTGAQHQRKPGVVDYNPRFFSFSDHFSTFSDPTIFFVLYLPRDPGVTKDGSGYLAPSFLAHFGIPLACLEPPSIYSVGSPDSVIVRPFQGTSVPLKGLSQPLSVSKEHRCLTPMGARRNGLYNLHLFPVSGHFFDFSGPDKFFHRGNFYKPRGV